MEVEGRLNKPPEQIVGIGLNVGVSELVFELMVTKTVSVQLIDEETTQ